MTKCNFIKKTSQIGIAGVFLFFVACTHKIQPLPKESYLLFIKAPQLKFNDFVWLSQNDEVLQLQAFSLGKSLTHIIIYKNKNKICLQKYCTNKTDFNQAYLGASYPKELFLQILLGQEIKEGQNRINIQNGFEQKIGSISYKKKGNRVLFKDTGLVVRIKKVEQ